MAEWKIILGKENKVLQNPRTKEEREVTYYQIVSHDGMSFTIGDYEIVERDSFELTAKGELPNSILEIDGVYYHPRGSQKYMSDFNGIVNVYIRDWKIAKPEYDITDVKLAMQYFKELIALKNDLLMLK